MGVKKENIFKNLKTFNYKLFIALCSIALAPAIYQLIRTFLIEKTVSSSAFDVIGQMEWFDLINETFLAFLIVPLYSVLNNIVKDNKEVFANYVFKMMIIVFLLYSLFQFGILIYGKYLIRFMNQNDMDLNIVNKYLYLETIAFILGIIYNFSNVVFVVIGRAKNMYILLVVNAFLLIITDFFFIPFFGIHGVAYSNMLINMILGIVCIIILIITKNMCFSFYKQFNLPIKIIRIGHTYGPGINLNDGRVFSDFIKNILDNKDLVIKSDGEAKRAFCYITDAINAFFLVLFNGKSGEAYNMSNNDYFVSIKELAEILTEKVFKDKGIDIIFTKNVSIEN